MDAAHQVPADTVVYVKPPQVGLPRQRHELGRAYRRPRVLSRHEPCEVRALARRGRTTWQHTEIRHTERGGLAADFAVQQVWTLTSAHQVRAEWLVIRRNADQILTYTLLNAPVDARGTQVIERSCQRYFVERVYQDAKSEIGWDDA